MFEFTTQNLYNNIVVATDEQVKSGAVKNANVITSASGTPSIRIGNTRFTADTIVSIDVKNPSDEYLAKVVFDMSEVVLEDDELETTGRIALYLGLSMTCQDSYYANDLVYKGKPLFVEFSITSDDDAASLANKVKSNVDKYMLFYALEKILNVTAAEGKVTIEGVNGYQLIKKAALLKYNPALKQLDCCTNEGGYENIIVGIPSRYKIDGGEVKLLGDDNTVSETGSYLDANGDAVEIGNGQTAIWPGLEAFGDYNWIIHNLRLPTLANTHFWSPTKEDMPAVGQVYTLFTIVMEVPNFGISGEAVGMKHTSRTTHVLYVAGEYDSSGDSPAKTVYTLLNTLAGSAISTDAEESNDPYHVVS